MLLKKPECFVETKYNAAVVSDLIDMWPGRGVKLTDNYLTHLTRRQICKADELTSMSTKSPIIKRKDIRRLRLVATCITD